MAEQKCIKCKADLLPGSVYCHICGKKQVVEKKKATKRANGTGSVYKRSDIVKRPWVASRNKVVIGYYETKKAALEALGRLSGQTVSERYNMTFDEVFKEWREEHYRAIGKSRVVQYNAAYKACKDLYDKKFRSLRTTDFQKIIDQHITKSSGTLSLYKQLLTQMSTWAIREEICTTNFATFVTIPKEKKEEQKDKKKVFSKTDIKKLEDNGSETAKIILMLIYSGMRIGEIFTLSLSDYHGDYAIWGEKSEAGRNRVIPIRPEGRQYFKYFAENATGDLLISGYTGHKNADKFRSEDYYPLLEELNIEKKTPHATRHTFASWARANGMRPEVLQKILGHAQYETTANIYVHTDIDELLSSVEI